MNELLNKIKKIEHGFKHIVETGNIILIYKNQNHFEVAINFLNDDNYQIRMLGTYLLGQLSTENNQALKLLEIQVAKTLIGEYMKC